MIELLSQVGTKHDHVLCDYSSTSNMRMCECILDNLQIGIVVTDPAGKIIFLNKPYAKFLGINAREQYGKNVVDVIENTRIPIVASTGKPELNELQRIRGKDAIVQRIPIKKENKVSAVLGIIAFKSVHEMTSLVRKINQLETKVKLYEREINALHSARYTIDCFVGKSATCNNLKEAIRKAALSDLPVLITGESGTGKEIVAQAIHNESKRKMNSFIRVNCPAIPDELLESELFGYEKGAFTGANDLGKPGKFELAHNGTIFLDEIGDLSIQIQPKLLRILEEKEFERLGGNTYITSNFRLITASNKNLKQMIENGSFRKDLFYRLRVTHIHLPPLRDRREDIIPIAEYLLEQISSNSLMPVRSLDAAAIHSLLNYDWPGNVRELRNMIESAASSCSTDTITLSDLSFDNESEQNLSSSTTCTRNLAAILHQAERDSIMQALAATNNNKTAAANLLGINRTLFHKKLKKHLLK
jgi:transcriptional regulator with PAS, ATPase and Fis domain